MIQGFCEKFLYVLNKRRDEYKNRIISGICRSYDDYRAVTGKIQGMDEAEGLLREIHKTYYPGVPININEGKHYVEVESDIT